MYYLETSYQYPYEIHSQFLFPVFVSDLLEDDLIINIEDNEQRTQGSALDSN
jgi:hypothetical protein